MLNVNINEKLPFMDALGYGGQMFLIGIATVFAVLGVIFLCLLIFKYVFSKSGAKEHKVEPKVAASVTPAPALTADTEIVAVIAAAIAMAESECGDGTKFRVVSFRRK